MTHSKTNIKEPDRGDPSDVLQRFPDFNIQLHCCRYWWLKYWEFKELSYPYWRIYHNTYKGAVILYNGKEYALTPDKIILIAPNTSYASRLFNNEIPETGYTLKGGQINVDFPENKIKEKHYMIHLFIHFNLGLPYDNVAPGIFSFTLTDHLKDKLIIIKEQLNYEHAKFSFYTNLVIQSLVGDLLVDLPSKYWELNTIDLRASKVMRFIDHNLENNLDNTVLSQIASMATNAFSRLFTQETGVSPQKFVRKKRIDKACVLLHHSNLSIDAVALQTGFADRYHFSRIFKQSTGISPARYKKEGRMNW
jgi:AraC-like DNA-binding protein